MLFEKLYTFEVPGELTIPNVTVLTPAWYLGDPVFCFQSGDGLCGRGFLGPFRV